MEIKLKSGSNHHPEDGAILCLAFFRGGTILNTLFMFFALIQLYRLYINYYMIHLFLANICIKNFWFSHLKLSNIHFIKLYQFNVLKINITHSTSNINDFATTFIHISQSLHKNYSYNFAKSNYVQSLIYINIFPLMKVISDSPCKPMTFLLLLEIYSSSSLFSNY